MNQYFIGQIILVGWASPFSGNVVGLLPCDGRLLSINENVDLFSLIGNVYGGDGQNNFALPNLSTTGILPPNTGTWMICTQGPWPPRD